MLASVNAPPVNVLATFSPLCFQHQKLTNFLLLQTKQKIRKLPSVMGAAFCLPDFTDAFLSAIWEANIATADILAS